MKLAKPNTDKTSTNSNNKNLTCDMEEERISRDLSVTENQIELKEVGTLEKIGNGFKYFWATKDTIGDTGDNNVKIKTTLRELVIYILFLIVLCVMTFGMTSSSMYYYNQAISNIFVGSPINGSDTNTFTSIAAIEDIWSFIYQPFLQSLYPTQWYNNQNFTSNELGFVMHENKLLGVPRIRQVKVKNNSCIIPDDFTSYIKECYDSYNDANEFKHNFGLANGSAWIYQTASKLNGSSYSGLISTYGGGGFAQDLGLTLSDSTEMVDNLYNNLWIDRGTRAVIMDFTLYNGNINLFCVVRLVGELPPTGGAFPSYSLQTVKLLRYVTPLDFFVLACEIFFIFFLIYYTVEEIIEIKINKMAYFTSFWNFLDILNLVIGYCCCIFDIYRTMAVNNTLDKLLKNPLMFADFSILSNCQSMANSALAIMVFFSWIKIFKYISFNKTMTQLSSTLSKCSKDLAGFGVMFFIFFLAFAQLGYLLFGSQDPDYSSIGTCIFTLFRWILGDFDFDSLQQANRILGPIYFVSYVFFVFFILLNMFLAIINDTYSEVKGDLAEAENEFEIGDYFKEGAFKMMEKFNLKKEKIMDLHDILKTGDLNEDGRLDFDEWRTNMKKRGYADAEIEAVFAKYDTDGDRGLDQNEQIKMEEDLLQQKETLDMEIDQTNNIVQSTKLMDAMKQRVISLEKTILDIKDKLENVSKSLEASEMMKNRLMETVNQILYGINESNAIPDSRQKEYISHMIKNALNGNEEH